MKQYKNRIIVAMDFSESSINALRTAIRFSEMHQSKMVLLHVLEPPNIAQWFGRKKFQNMQEELAEKKVQELKVAFKDADLVLHAEEGNPSKVIVDFSFAIKAEMIVMGSSGWSSEGKKHTIGTHGIHIVRNAGCPVVTVKRINKNPQFKKILIPVDMELGMKDIRGFLKDFKGKYQDHIELITVLNDKHLHDPKAMDHATIYMGKERLMLMKQGFKNVDVEIIKSNDVVKAIDDYADSHENEIDLIMMETHGRTGLNRMMSGSVTEAVLNHTGLPVFSLRPELKGQSFGSVGY